jgi:DNA-binding NarL/FixJ family response regulator
VRSQKVQRILIVDDHPLVVAGLISLIRNEPDLEVCGETGKVSEALELAGSEAPDLVIVDISLADGNGLELVKRLLARNGGLKVLVCSMHDEALFAHRALNAGAKGYINKQEATIQIIDAIRHVLKNKIWLSEPMTERVLQTLAADSNGIQTTSIGCLSDRELEVFGLIGQGMGPKQIAEQLHLSVKTVETHRERIKKKLNLQSAGELVRSAVEWTLDQG